MSATVSLRADGVGKSFGGLRAVSGVDLELLAGQTLGIIGPNGAGKSTLVNLLSGQIRLDTGRVTLDETDVSNLGMDARARLGLARTFQHTKVLNSFTVREALALSIGSPRARADNGEGLSELADSFGLAEFVDRGVPELPYGAQKVLNLAMVAATRPQVILLDEPFAGVPRADVDVLGSVINRLRGEGVAIALIEHDMRALMELSDSVLVLDAGKVMTQGSPEDVQRDPHVRKIYLGQAS